MNLPNLLTVMRVILVPFIVLFYVLPADYQWKYYVASGLFIIASITDWLDGYLARKLNAATQFGAFLDPVADKIAVSVVLITIAAVYSAEAPSWSLFVTIPVLIIVTREFVVSGVREWMAELGKRAAVNVSMAGKVKTTLQMIAIIILLARPADINDPLVIIGMISIYIAVALTVYSMLIYLKAARPYLSLTSSEENKDDMQ